MLLYLDTQGPAGRRREWLPVLMRQPNNSMKGSNAMNEATTTNEFGSTGDHVYSSVLRLERNYDLQQLETMSGRIKQHIREWIETMQEAQANIVSNIDDGCYINADNLYNPVEYANRLAEYMHGLHQVQQRIVEIKDNA